MMKLTIKQVQNIVAGEIVAIRDEDLLISDISIDSRQISENALFVALSGEKFDGHDFAQQSINSGALAVLVNHKINDVLPQIIVKDTRLALGQIAAWIRQQSKAKIVALTGSSGKTSVKEMTAAILAKCGKTLFTQGNFNNDIGVPLTLFGLTKEHKYAVIELGANHIGEIAYTTKMVKPHSALINNIAAAHLEGFGSLAGVAKAKGEIFLGLPADGVAIFNFDSYSPEWFKLVEGYRVYTFALNTTEADFYAKSIIQQDVTSFVLHTPFGEINIQLPLLGLHNVSNAIAAAALAMSVGAGLEDIKSGLQNVKSVKGRLFPIRLNDNQLILDDSYNANMGSMTAAIQVLAQQKGYRILVVGDMAELGEDAALYHQKIGEEARRMALDCVVSVGKNSALISQYSGVGHHFANKKDAVVFLQKKLQEKLNLTLLVKGSRSAKMEEIIDSLRRNQE